MQPESGLRTWQWVVSVIVVIVLIVIGIMVFGKKAPTAEIPNETPPVTTSNTPGVNSIIMSDQYPGNVVYVSSVRLINAGWVVIHKDNKGEVGDIIGYVWVNEGVNPAKITLTSPIVDGGTYYAMLHSDNGDKVFNATTDLPLKDSNGNIILRIFRGSISADQSSKG